MFPYVILLGGKFSMYQILSLCGIFAAGIYAYRAAKRIQYSKRDIIVFLLISGAGAFLGGHILYGLLHFRRLAVLGSAGGFFNGTRAAFGGSVFYGGLAGGIAAAFLYSKKTGNDFQYLADLLTPAIPLFHFFGRIGCFLAGCCFGIESFIGFTYTHSLVNKANGINRFPVQLLESLLNLALFFILLKTKKSNSRKGNQLFLYLLLYSLERFFLEFIRGDEYRGKWLVFSTSQWISVFIFIISAIKLYRALFRSPSADKNQKSQ
jgi:phosphatidylglycerol:prolipoprotein diacylglycerol transferase